MFEADSEATGGMLELVALNACLSRQAAVHAINLRKFHGLKFSRIAKMLIGNPAASACPVEATDLLHEHQVSFG